ncbi:Beta-galactosidase [Quillaja saponaria]|uniref:Beta-galactosidase n=1 Tax=Quillaja saponaria TaxID=32244 RepID=A0AAD7LZP0_QUISA|nr:Beta-galactosidase [Quillaja saponaria]
MAAASRWLLITLLALVVSTAIARGVQKVANVTYEGRSLLLNGKRELFFSGSIHYPRSTPDMWPDLLAKARHGGLNVIQTYVFWNIHEPVQGQYNFTGNYDLVKFIRLVQQYGMYVNLRIGPFIQAEWNHGGLPYWLREVPGIIFRSDNEPFKTHMKKYVQMIIDMVKKENLFAPQGGPIILAQIENEYNHVQRAYRHKGDSYVQWAANMAVSMNTGVPWVMCKQKDAPDPVINTCNGRHCGDTFSGPNKPNKPALWTENWTAQYRVFGDPASQRSAEDISFSVARFFSKNGSLANYYMYHGGTNFGRTSSAFSTTRYYDEAPLDEFGLQREPKWSHLRDLHKALNQCKKALLWGESSFEKLTKHTEVRVYKKAGTNICAAFLTNNDTKKATTIKFRGDEFYLPPRSISILPDCKTVVYNTLTIVSQHNSRNFQKSIAAGSLKWKMFSEALPTTHEVPVNSQAPLELYGLLKDTTDYAWYTTRINLGVRDLPMREDILPVLRVMSLGHAMLAFVNGEYIGSAHGSHEEKGFVFEKAVNFKPGANQIAILASTVGLPDSGAYMEHRYAGPKAITILGLNTGTIDLSVNGWGHQVGLSGEKLGIFSEEGSTKVQWKDVSETGPAATWYQSKFNAPEGRQPVAIRMTGMGKGMVWVNGRSIGRHWMSYLSPLGQPTQSEYHIPRGFLKPTDNHLVVFEEEKASPEKIEIVTVDRDTICSFITEYRQPGKENSHIRTVVDVLKPGASLNCPNHKKIVAVEFASFGDPFGPCGNYRLGTCNAPSAKQIVEQNCLGKTSCSVPIDRELFNKKGDACPDIMKTLAVQVKCSH